MIFTIPTSASSKIDRSSNWVVTEMAHFRLISGVSNIGDSNKVPLGLEFELKDDWKIYWRNPGDAGYPPEIDFGNSKNLSEIELHAGIAFVEAKRLISDVNLLAPSSEYLSLLSVKSAVLPAFIATTNIQAN